MFQPWQGSTFNLQNLQTSRGSKPDVIGCGWNKTSPPQKRKLYQTNIAHESWRNLLGAAKVLQRTTEDTQVQFILGKNTTCSIACAPQTPVMSHIGVKTRTEYPKASVRHTVELAGRLVISKFQHRKYSNKRLGFWHGVQFLGLLDSVVGGKTQAK